MWDSKTKEDFKEFQKFSEWTGLLTGVFLLLLALGGNLVGNLFTIKIRDAIRSKPLVKYSVLFFMTYFAASFVSTVGDYRVESPSKTFVKALGIFVVLLVVGRLNWICALTVLLLFALVYVLENYKHYLHGRSVLSDSHALSLTERTKNKNLRVAERLQKALLGLALIFVIVGLFVPHRGASSG